MLILIPIYLLICTAIGALCGSAIAGLIVGASPLVLFGLVLIIGFTFDEVSASKRRRANIRRARERQGLPAKRRP